MVNADRCICCGEIIPEGMMVCPHCLVASKKKTELKPCPFCGGEELHVVSVYGEDYYVDCLTCTTCGPSGETEEEAIEAWNRRAEDGK